MQYIFGFSASEQQYKRKLTQWRFVKNHKSSTYRMIGHTLNRRRLDPYSAEVRIGNEVLSPQRLQRRLRRHNPPTLQMQNPRSGIACRTSSVRGDPAYQSAGAVNISITRAVHNPDALSSEALPAFQLYEKIRSLSLNSPGPRRQPSRIRRTPTFNNDESLPTNPGDISLTVHATPFPDNNGYHDSRLLISDGFGVESMQTAGGHGFDGPNTNGSVSWMIPSWYRGGSERTWGYVSALFPVHDSYFVLEDLRSVSSMSAPQANMVAIGYVIYLCSNGEPEQRPFDDFLDQLFQTGIERLLRNFDFMDSNSPPLRRFAEHLLLYAARKDRCDLLEFLQKTGMDLSRPLKVHGQIRTPLQEAIVYRNAAFCKRLLIDYGTDSNTYFEEGSVPLYWETPSNLAARYLPEIFWIIQKKQRTTFDQDFPGAVMAGLNVDDILTWLVQGADINALDERLRTALHHSIEKEDVLLAKFLLKHGAQVDGWGSVALEQMLATAGDIACLMAKFSKVPSPWSLAVETGNVELCEALLDAGLEVLLLPMDRFASALETLREGDWHLGDWSFLRRPRAYISLLEYISSGSRTEISQMLSPLLFAVCAGNRQIVELVLETGANVHEATHDLWFTPLQAASYGGAVDILSVLVGADADINTHSALQAAVLGNHLDATKFLLEHKVDVHAACAEVFGCTALQAAAYKGEEDLVRILLYAGADPNALKSEKFGYTALEAAIRAGKPIFNQPILTTALRLYLMRNRSPELSILERLCDLGAVLDGFWVDESLLEASLRGDLNCVKFLLEHGANVNGNGAEDDLTPLAAASCCGHLDVVQYLLEHGADVNPHLIHTDSSPLQSAAYSGYVRIAQLLLGAGADVRAVGPRESNSMSAVDLAAGEGHLDMVQLLLDNYQLKEGESLVEICAEAAAIARDLCQWVVADFLENYRRNSPPPSRPPEGDVFAGGDVFMGGSISAMGGVSAMEDVSGMEDVIAIGNVPAGENILAGEETEDIFAGEDIFAEFTYI
ncbi:hypothetical protein ABEF91_005417 [Exophiala dermatitidis]